MPSKVTKPNTSAQPELMSIGSYGRKWVMRVERAAYRGGRPNLPEPP